MNPMKPLAWTDVRTLDEALLELRDGAVLKAGGIDLQDLLKEGLSAPRRVINLRNVKSLRHIKYHREHGLRVGSLTTLQALGAHPAVRENYPLLAAAAAQAATPNIRNAATLGGNLLQRPRCWYFRSADFPCRKKGGSRCFALEGENEYHAIFKNQPCAMVHPSSLAVALVALDAEVELMSRAGRRSLPLSDFFVHPSKDMSRETDLRQGEMVTELRVGTEASGAAQAFVKLGHRQGSDWPLAEVGVRLDLSQDQCREAWVILGAAAALPFRASLAEARLRGRRLHEALFDEAAQAAVAEATPLSQNGYKTTLFRTAVRRGLEQAFRERKA